MSRSVADYLVKEHEYENEYKKNFYDKVLDDSENSASNNLEDDYFNEIDESIQNNIKINKLHNYFLDMKNNCLKMGYLQNMSFYDFCCLIGEKNLFKKN
jgi:hypothetical protein